MNRTGLQPEPITQEFNSRLITAALKTIEWPTVDLHDAEAVKSRILEYFQLCDQQGLRPSNLGLYAALNTTKQRMSDIASGRQKVTPEVADLLQKARTALSSYREQLAMAGKVSPPIAIFWAKNFDGMEDYQRIDVARADITSGPVTITAEEARAALEDMSLDDMEDDEEGSY